VLFGVNWLEPREVRGIFRQMSEKGLLAFELH
jgi:hypothetical protein